MNAPRRVNSISGIGARGVPTTHLLINAMKLPGPLDVVEKLSLVKAVVVWAVTLGMIGRGQHGHLVAIDGVQLEKQLHFLRNLKKMEKVMKLTIVFSFSLKHLIQM